MKYRTFKYAGLLLALLVAKSIYAAQIDDFYSDEYVGKAVTHIGELDKDEIEYFIDYLASCTVPTESETQQFYCERDRVIFEIKYIKQNELRSLINTMSVIDLRIKQLSNSSSGSDERKELTKLLFRSNDVIRKLRDAVTIYYGVVNKR